METNITNNPSQEFITLVRINNVNDLNQVRNHITDVFGLKMDEDREDREDNNAYIEEFEGVKNKKLFANIYATEEYYKEQKMVSLVCESDNDLEEGDERFTMDLQYFLKLTELPWSADQNTNTKSLCDTELDRTFQTFVPCKNKEQFEKIIDHLKEIGLNPYEDPDYDFEECISFIENGNDEDSEYYDPEDTTYIIIYAGENEYFNKKRVWIATVCSSDDLEEGEEEESAVGYFEFLENDSLDWF